MLVKNDALNEGAVPGQQGNELVFEGPRWGPRGATCLPAGRAVQTQTALAARVQASCLRSGGRHTG